MVYRNPCGVYDWDTALAWIAGGKNKNIPYTTGYKRSLYKWGGQIYLHRSSHDRIDVVMVNDVVVTYRSDGITEVSAPTKWQCTRGLIMQYAPVKLFIRKNQLVIHADCDGSTPQRQQRCRTCHGLGKVDGWCSGTNYPCKTEDCEKLIQRNKLIDSGVPFWDEKVRELYHLESEHGKTCTHGNAGYHTIPRGQDCHRCSGSGTATYGGKLRGRIWDGSTIGIDANGNYVDVSGGN